MKRYLLSFTAATCLLVGCTKEEPLSVKSYFIGLAIKDCPSNNSTINKWESNGITHCLLQPTTYAGFETFSYEIEIFDGLVHAVKLVIRPQQNSTIKSAMVSKYGNPIQTSPSTLEWRRGSQILFLFDGNTDTIIQLVDRANQDLHRQKTALDKAKDL